MRGACHLCCYGCERLAAPIRIGPIGLDIALELVPEAVVPLPDCDLAGHPEGSAQSGIAELGEVGAATKGAGLVGLQIQAAELQELAMMPKAAQIAGLGQHGQRVDRTDAGNGHEPLIVGMPMQPLDGEPFDPVALADQTAAFYQHHSEHGHGVGAEVDRQAY